MAGISHLPYSRTRLLNVAEKPSFSVTVGKMLHVLSCFASNQYKNLVSTSMIDSDLSQ